VPSIDYSLKEMKLAPFNESLNNLLSKEIISELKNYCFKDTKSQKASKSKSKKVNEPLSTFSQNKLSNFIEETRRTNTIRLKNNDEILEEIINILNNVRVFYNVANGKESAKSKKTKSAGKNKTKQNPLIEIDENDKDKLLIFILLNTVLYSSNISEDLYQIDLFDKLLLNKSLYESLGSLGHNSDNILKETSLLNALLSKGYLSNKKLQLNDNSLELFVSDFLNGKQISEHLMLNEFKGNLYYNKEKFEETITWLFRLYLLTEFLNSNQKIKDEKIDKTAIQKKLTTSQNRVEKFINKIIDASEKAQYKVKELKRNLEKDEVIKTKPAKRVKKSESTKTKIKKKKKN